MNPTVLRALGRLVGRPFPGLAASLARYLAVTPLNRSRRPDPTGAEPVTFRFGLAGLGWRLRRRRAGCYAGVTVPGGAVG